MTLCSEGGGGEDDDFQNPGFAWRYALAAAPPNGAAGRRQKRSRSANYFAADAKENVPSGIVGSRFYSGEMVRRERSVLNAAGSNPKAEKLKEQCEDPIVERKGFDLDVRIQSGISEGLKAKKAENRKYCAESGFVEESLDRRLNLQKKCSSHRVLLEEKEEADAAWNQVGFSAPISCASVVKEASCPWASVKIKTLCIEGSDEGDSAGSVDWEDFDAGTQLNELMDICAELGSEGDFSEKDFAEKERVECPLCEMNITDLNEELRQRHTNDCLDGSTAAETSLHSEGVFGKVTEEKSCSSGRSPISSDNVEFEIQHAVLCPLCGADISDINEESRQRHTNNCLDMTPTNDQETKFSRQATTEGSSVVEFLRELDLSKYEGIFLKEEIDLETLRCLKEEDLINMGITALGPRKKIMHALDQLQQKRINMSHARMSGQGNKLITQFFRGMFDDKKSASSPRELLKSKRPSNSTCRTNTIARRGKYRDVPSWCCIPGTPFRVDAFRYLRGDCSHWFLTHFHLDHYQGLTRSFCHGKIYCSSITARLVNLKIGVPLDRLQILPLNEKVTVAGIDLICFDANHCPGSIMILFQPSNGNAVLHTGDFRFSSEMTKNSLLQSCSIHTLILDTTYCKSQYDFPKQEVVIQFVIEAIQAETFNPKTLFLIGSYTIGKERLFLEVARLLRRKIYVGTAKFQILRCLELPDEDMQWITSDERESQIHVVPLWMLGSFKRMKCISNQYSGRYDLIIAFSPTGWTFGKGRKKSNGSQQGTLIRYEVPYSEHCSFSELQEFVRFISPAHIIPSVNNSGPESARAMLDLLLSDT